MKTTILLVLIAVCASFGSANPVLNYTSPAPEVAVATSAPMPGFEGPYLFVWTNTECPVIATKRGNVDYCGLECLADSRCSVLDFQPATGYCHLRLCQSPVPDPHQVSKGWLGYKRE